MPRARSFTDSEFTLAYRRCQGQAHLIAAELGCSTATVYNYVDRLGLKRVKRSTPKQCEEVLNELVGEVTLNDLAEKYEVTRLTIRNWIFKAIASRWKRRAYVNGLPRPSTLSEVRVYNALRDMPEESDARTIAAAADTPERYAVNYIRRIRKQ